MTALEFSVKIISRGEALGGLDKENSALFEHII